jgi:hypothetical protein
MLEEMITFAYSLLIFIGLIFAYCMITFKDPNEDIKNNIKRLEDGEATNLESKNNF